MDGRGCHDCGTMAVAEELARGVRAREVAEGDSVLATVKAMDAVEWKCMEASCIE